MIEDIKRLQTRVGVTADGAFGPATLSAVMAALDRAKVPAAAAATASGIADEAAFFNGLRGGGLFPNGLQQPQVDGLKAKLAAFGAAGWPLSFAAYGLATSYWETARTLQPIEEYGKGKGRRYGVPGRNGGQVAYGRGDVQLTWDENYERADRELGLNGALIADYSLALRPDISARIMVAGMEDGWFTGRKLADMLPTKGPATAAQFKASRPIINGHDKDDEIAAIAMKFQAALQTGGWA